MFCKNPTKKHIGDIMIGFCILMVGMQNMSAAVAPLRSEPAFIDMLTKFSNPFIGILIGLFGYCCFAECICYSWYSSGFISYRSYFIFSSTAYYNGYCCRSLPCLLSFLHLVRLQMVREQHLYIFLLMHWVL